MIHSTIFLQCSFEEGDVVNILGDICRDISDRGRVRERRKQCFCCLDRNVAEYDGRACFMEEANCRGTNAIGVAWSWRVSSTAQCKFPGL